MLEDLAVGVLRWLNELPNKVAGIRTGREDTYPSVKDTIRVITAQILRSSIFPISIAAEVVVDYILLSNPGLWRAAAKASKDLLLSTFIFIGDESKRWLGNFI